MYVHSLKPKLRFTPYVRSIWCCWPGSSIIFIIPFNKSMTEQSGSQLTLCISDKVKPPKNQIQEALSAIDSLI